MVKMLKTTMGWLKSVTLSGDWGRPFYLATMTGDAGIFTDTTG